MKILVGIDDSKSSADVLRALVTQFRTENTEVRVLHVLQPMAPAPPQMAPGYAPELEEQKKPAQELVERIAKELRSAGFRVDTAVEVGDIKRDHYGFRSRVGRRSHRGWLARAGRHPAFAAGQRRGIGRPPCQVLGGNCSPVAECLKEPQVPHPSKTQNWLGWGARAAEQ